MQRGLVMITCNGAFLGYGFAAENPYLKTLLQGARIPRTDQLPAIPAEHATPAIFCGPGPK